MREQMEKWLKENPDATLRDAFEAGWYGCTDAWCRGKREKMEECIGLMKELIR